MCSRDLNLFKTREREISVLAVFGQWKVRVISHIFENISEITKSSANEIDKEKESEKNSRHHFGLLSWWFCLKQEN